MGESGTLPPSGSLHVGRGWFFDRLTTTAENSAGISLQAIESIQPLECRQVHSFSRRSHRLPTTLPLSLLRWKCRKRSSVETTERIYEEATKALRAGREGRHFEETFGGRSADLRSVSRPGAPAVALCNRRTRVRLELSPTCYLMIGTIHPACSTVRITRVYIVHSPSIRYSLVLGSMNINRNITAGPNSRLVPKVPLGASKELSATVLWASILCAVNALGIVGNTVPGSPRVRNRPAKKNLTI